MLGISGDTSWRDRDGGGAANATVLSSRDVVKASALKAFIAIDGDS